MSTKATQETALSVFETTNKLLKSGSIICNRNVTKIDAGGYTYQDVEHLIDGLRGIYSQLPNAANWGAGLVNAVNSIASNWLNVTDWDQEVIASKASIATVLQTASGLFLRDGSDNVLYKQITPGQTTYSSPASTVGLRADLVSASNQIG